ncbi:MAG TPA: PepSY domain-containing protein [Polyangiales bacterium]
MSVADPASVVAPNESSMHIERSARRTRQRGRVLRVVRRLHMYAGLVLMPWLMFFGLSGMLFNHPNLGEQVEGQRVSAEDLSTLSQLQPWRPSAVAADVIEALNHADASGGPYRLDPAFDSGFVGYAVMNAPAPDGGYMLILDVAGARGVLVHKVARKSEEGSSFPRLTLALPEYSSATLERHVQGLLSARKLPHAAELHAHPKIAPELRLRALDAQGQAWNLSYDVRTGELSGRRADRFPNLGISQLLASMHKTHHFTLEFGPLWLWALFEDLLGLAMVVWALTGIVMWWQLKRTRLVGVISLAVALGVAGSVMFGTLHSLTFGDVRAAMGPGD